MKISFDGLRMNLAKSYNELFCALRDSTDDEKQVEAMLSLRQNIGILLCMYDDSNKEDSNCLIDDIELLNFEPDEDEL